MELTGDSWTVAGVSEMLQRLPGAAPDPSDPEGLLRWLEQRADLHPGEIATRRAIRAVHGLATAERGLTPTVAGVRRETLVRWDGISTTWTGYRSIDGQAAMVRILRPDAARDPVARRTLKRTASLLGDWLSDLQHVDTPWPAIVQLLPGAAIREVESLRDDPHPAARIRVLATALASWKLAASRGVLLPTPVSDELRQSDNGGKVVVLTLADESSAEGLSALAGTLAPLDPDHPLDVVLAGLAAFPPAGEEEATDRLLDGISEDLTATLVAVGRRWAGLIRHDQRARLHDLIDRLDAAVRRPLGRGLVGVDLDGRTTIVLSDEQGVRWGPLEGPHLPVWTPGVGFDARGARRLLRALAAAPANARLATQIGATPGASEQLSSWTSTGLRSRTLRMLLEVPPA